MAGKGITEIPVRATIVVGGVSVKTPYVLNFSVNKTRNQSVTAQANLKIRSFNVAGLSGGVTISAGTLGAERLIFTGVLRKLDISPCWDDPSYVIVNISASDKLYLLDQTRFTRRQLSTNGGPYATINGIQNSYSSTALNSIRAENKVYVDPAKTSSSITANAGLPSNASRLDMVGSAETKPTSRPKLGLEVVVTGT